MEKRKKSICEKVIMNNNVHLGHDHMTGVVSGFTHAECNQNLEFQNIFQL